MVQKRKFIGLQLLRAFAAVLVVFQHSLDLLNRHGKNGPHEGIGFGHAGVDIFFVISGFIMVYITASRSLHTQVSPLRRSLNFFRDRLVRVVPTYWFWTTVFAILLAFFPSFAQTGVFSWSHLIKSYLFIPSYHPNPEYAGTIWPVLVPGWTLNYEMFFYAIFGMCLLMSTRFLSFVSFCICVLLLVCGGYWFEPSSPELKTYTNPLLIEFLAGAFIANAVLRFGLPGVAWGVVCLVCGVALLLLSDPSLANDTHRLLKYGIPGVLLVVGALGIEPLFRKGRLALFLGDASYSVYLTHPFTLAAAGLGWTWVGAELSLWQEVCLTAFFIFLCVLVGAIAYLLVERPALRLFRRRRAQAVATA